MYNIFDFATKELSQDAFLCWFIANCNEPSIGEHSYRFINFLTGYDFKFGDIKRVTIKQQEHNLDIIVDLWTTENLHYVIVIEDKTTSSAHSGQLKKYADIMDGWNRNEKEYISRRRKVFYKIDHLTDQDKLELNKGNDGFDKDDCWRIIDIDDIYSFFSVIQLTKSEILNSYVEHIKQIYRDLNVPSKRPISEWNYANFQTFFREIIDKELSKKRWSYHYETWLYQGRLVSVAFYYHPKNKKLDKDVSEKYKSFAYPLVEFVFRKNTNEITVYSHITYHWYDDKKYKNDPDRWTWKHSEYEPNLQEAQTFMETVKHSLSEIVTDAKTRKMKSARDQTISTDSIVIGETNNSLEKVILAKLTSYFEAFENADEKY